MSNQQKRGFRLPWNDRGPEDGVAAATIDASTLDTTPAAVSDESGDGASPAAGASPPASTTDAAPAASNVPVSPEAEMIDADRAAKERIERAMNAGAWPTTEWKAPPQGSAPTSTGEESPPSATPAAETPPAETPPAEAEGAEPPAAEAVPMPPVRSDARARAPRKDNPLVAGLVKAMREAAVASRAETTTRLEAEVTARVEAIRNEATTQSAELRKRVDDDVAKIREWSKGEVARIRQETDERIEARRNEAITETQAHADAVERLVEQVQGQVTAYEADMDRFFERLLAETDPAMLASLAEQAPEPPDLTDELAMPAAEWQDATWSSDVGSAMIGEAESDAAEVTGSDAAETTDATNAGDAVDATAATEASETTEATAEPLEAAAAAEAEAEATEGLEMPADDAWPAAVLAAARRSDAAASTTADDAGHSRLLVTGLTSVAGISAFKGAVGQLPGVRSVSVTSGERGVFIFNVNHEPETDIAEAVTGLTSFAVRITEASGDTVSVTANEPAA